MARTVASLKLTGRPAGGGRFLRIDDVVASIGLSRPTIYRLIRLGVFPSQIALTARSVGWWEADVNAWLCARRGQQPA